MSLVNIVNVQILNNPCHYSDAFQIEITFEVLAELAEDLEFKIVYVGSAESESHDQTLESVMVGPVPVGTSKFLLEAPAPDPRKIPDQDIIGVTVILLMCLYREREFLRVGYYINNDYADERLRDERAKELKPAKPDLAKMQRSILAEKPRVTRFSIPWDNDESAQMQTENGQENDENAMEMDVGQEASGIAAGSPEKGMTGMSREGGPVQTMST